MSEENPLPGTVNVLSIAVSREVNRLASATIIIQDGQASAQEFMVSNGEQLIPRKKIEIKVGYRADEETIFKGIVIRHSVKVRKNVSLLVVECRHEAVKMTTQLSNAYFHDQTDLEVAEQLIQKYGLTASTGGEVLTHKELVQFNATDWDYMLCRAEANRLWVLTDDDTIRIAPPDFGTGPHLIGAVWGDSERTGCRNRQSVADPTTQSRWLEPGRTEPDRQCRSHESSRASRQQFSR